MTTEEENIKTLNEVIKYLWFADEKMREMDTKLDHLLSELADEESSEEEADTSHEEGHLIHMINQAEQSDRRINWRCG